MSPNKVYTFRQVFLTKHHANWGICEDLYIYVSKMCQHSHRFIFNKLTNKLTQYTSYKVGNLSKVVLTKKKLRYAK